jgi:Tfp pilus assembly protein PilV
MATRKKKGLTLIEVMLIIAFLSIIFPPILQMFSKGFMVSQESESTLTASSLAQKVIEEEKNLPYSNIASIPKTAIPGFTGFSKKVDVTEVSPNLKDITVTLYYPVENAELSMVLETLVANI